MPVWRPRDMDNRRGPRTVGPIVVCEGLPRHLYSTVTGVNQVIPIPEWGANGLVSPMIGRMRTEPGLQRESSAARAPRIRARRRGPGDQPDR
jgi:hypothetical protein